MIRFDNFKEGCPWRTPVDVNEGGAFSAQEGNRALKEIKYVCAGQGTSIEGDATFGLLVGCQECVEERCAPFYWVNCRR